MVFVIFSYKISDMKSIYAVIFSLLALGSFAQTRTTIANGNATNPFTWDCTCVPTSGNDIVINHQLTLDVDFAYTSGSVTVNASGALLGNSPNRILAVGGGAFHNYGNVNIANMYQNGGTFMNHATMTITNAFGVDLTAVTSNMGTFTVSDSLYINSSATFSNTGTLNAVVTASAGTLTTTGSFTGTDLWTTGTVNHNSGSFSIANIYNSGTLTTQAPMIVSNDFWNAENVDINHDLIISHSLYNGDTTGGGATFNNDGLVSITQDFVNSKTVSGTGRFCIGQGTTNSGSINGTLDICDQTGGSIDLNSGTVAGTVTFCATSCNVGVEETSSNEVHIVPNPFNDVFEIRSEQSMNYQLTVVNAIGQQVLSMNYNGNVIRLDASTLSSGMYFYRLVSNRELVSSGKLIKR